MPKITEGQPWPRRRNAVERAAVRLFAGSSSKNYHQADWYETDINPELAEYWPKYAGDRRVPESFGIPILRKAKLAGIVAVRTEALKEIRGANPGAVNGMVTRSLGGKVYACMLPEGVEPWRSGMDGQDCEITAARIGQGTLYFMPTVIVPETSRIIVPEATVGDVRRFDPREFVPQLKPPFEHVPVL